MIVLEIDNIKPYPFNGNAVKILGQGITVKPPTEENEICICDYIACNYKENVFYSADGADYKNDKSDFLFRRIISSDSITLYLVKNGVETELTDDTYGELFDGFSEGTEDQQKYYGYAIDWNKVGDTLGVGIYTLKAELSILGTDTEYISREFELNVYSDIAADGTVKIESVQNGNIIGSDFDFTDLEWNQYLRVPGRFGNPTPQYETSRYLDQNYNFKQIKDKMTRVWDLNTGLINWEVAEKLVYNKVMANEIYITDYSIKAESIWRRIQVRLEEIEKPPIPNSKDRRYLFKFVDNREIYQKRNF